MPGNYPPDDSQSRLVATSRLVQSVARASRPSWRGRFAWSPPPSVRRAARPCSFKLKCTRASSSRARCSSRSTRTWRRTRRSDAYQRRRRRWWKSGGGGWCSGGGGSCGGGSFGGGSAAAASPAAAPRLEQAVAAWLSEIPRLAMGRGASRVLAGLLAVARFSHLSPYSGYYRVTALQAFALPPTHSREPWPRRSPSHLTAAWGHKDLTAAPPSACRILMTEGARRRTFRLTEHLNQTRANHRWIHYDGNRVFNLGIVIRKKKGFEALQFSSGPSSGQPYLIRQQS